MLLDLGVRDRDALDALEAAGQDRCPGKAHKDFGGVWVFDDRSLVHDQHRLMLIDEIVQPGPERSREVLELHLFKLDVAGLDPATV